MAESIDFFSCLICLDLLKDPVTIPCGHSYCMGCIKGWWDQEDQKGVYSCTLCKKSFISRPVLRKNTLLAEIVENLKKTGLQAAPPAHCYAGPGDVACDVCTGRKLKALKSCLVCLSSYCETHLQPHYEFPALKKHKLVKASTQLQEKICSHHDEVMKIFCHTDQLCICLLCSIDEHKGHDTVSATAERMEKQRQLGMSQQDVQQRVQKREKQLKEIQQAVESLTRSAQTAVEDSERIFTELICSIERRLSEVKQLIRAQQEAAVSQAKGLVEKLKQEIAELRRRDAELEQLSHTENSIHFLQSYQSLSSPSVCLDFTSIIEGPLQLFGGVSEAVSELRDKLEDLLKGEWPNISTTDSCELTLEPNTAHRYLSLSEENRKVTLGREEQPYPDHAERFERCPQVLCKEGLTGRRYWEVECSGGGADIGVTYKGISRRGKGYDCRLGNNDKSWSLFCSGNSYSAWHNKKRTDIPVPSSGSHRIGVYLDWPAGTLSFYSVSSDTQTFLYTFHSTFTEPLYPVIGFWYEGCSVTLCKLVSGRSP